MGMHFQDAGFSAIDLETTGLDTRTDEIIAFACVPIQDMKIQVRTAYYTLVKPETYCIASMKYHGISQRDLENALPFRDVAGKILESLEGILIGYCIEFDYQILNRDFKKIGVKLKKETVDIARVEHWLGSKDRTAGRDLAFEAIMQRYGLQESYRHNALADAFFVAQIFQYQISELLKYGVDSTSKLLRALKRYRYALW